MIQSHYLHPGRMKCLKLWSIFTTVFFDTTPATEDAEALANEPQNLVSSQEEYPFLYALILPLHQIIKLADQPAAFFSADFHRQAEEFLTYKDTVIGPIKRFMGGEQKTIYDNCRSLRRN
jgi:hypothetical protein